MLIRNHEEMESKLRRQLDVSLGKNASEKRAKNSPQNLFATFKASLTMLKNYKPAKKKKQSSIKIKRKMVGSTPPHVTV
jgi:hypothetical protein